MHKSDTVKQACEDLYSALTSAGYDVLFMDEQKARLGSMLADIELIGIPHRLVIGDRGLEEGKIEYRDRTQSENQHIEADQLMAFISEKLGV